MRNISVILRKELRAYFDSSLAYIFITIFLLLAGAYVATNLFLANTASLVTFFEIAPLLLLMFAPAVTMRLIAEEKRVGTFEVLKTKPISIGQIVVGKFFAGWVLVCAALLPTMLYVVTISSFGDLDTGALIGGYLGLILLGGVFVAAGEFGSSLSDNQIVALILGFLICFVLFALDKVLAYVPIGLVSTVEYVGVGHHFSSLARGVIDSRDIIYYLSLIVLFVVLATVSASQETGQSLWRWRDFKIGQRFARASIVIGILVFANLISVRSFARFDITENQAYTLSDVTKKFLSSLDDTFLVRAYFSPELPPPYHNHRRSVQQLLEELRANSNGRFHYKFINPLAGAAEEQDALREGITPVQVKVIRNNRFQSAKAYAGLAFSYADKVERLPIIESLDRLEYEMTASLKKMTSSELKTIGILTDGGGPGPERMKTFLGALGRQHAVVSVQFSNGPLMPQHYTALLVIAPTRRFTDVEKIQLDQYIMRGGRVAFFMNSVVPDAEMRYARPTEVNLDDMFDVYGWILHKDLVADGRCAPYLLREGLDQHTYASEVLYPFYPVASDFSKENDLLRSTGPVMFPFVSSLDMRLATIRGVTDHVVVMSSTLSRRYPVDGVVISPRTTVTPDEFEDKHISLGAVLEGNFKSAFSDIRDPSLRDIVTHTTAGTFIPRGQRTRLSIVGDGDFLLDEHVREYDNVSFAVNLVDWIVEDTVLSAVRTRDVAPPPLQEVSEQTKNVAKYFSFAGPPGVVILGGMLWMLIKGARRRRHKHSF
ncbi:MAG: Gldg family protein [Bacteroidota bacterium]